MDTWVNRVLAKHKRRFANSLQTTSGLVVSTTNQTCFVETSIGILNPDITGHSPVVGDLVSLACNQDNLWGVTEILPRKSKLSRPDVDRPDIERVIVANIDVVVIVVSVGSPPLHPRIIDRYLAAIKKGGAAPLVCVNKCDLLVSKAELNVLLPYKQIGIPICEASVIGALGLDKLLLLLAGKTSVFVGHSGVGKSSLINALLPNSKLAVGDVSEGNSRGTHTTTTSSLWHLPGGTNVIDSPGVRAFGLWKMTRQQLQSYFPEFQNFTCRFRDCDHNVEPGCEVREAVIRDEIAQERLDTYHRLREEVS